MALNTETESSVPAAKSVRIETVLCPIDFSAVSEKALGYAQSIACHYRAELILHHVVELWRYPSAGYVAAPKYYDAFREALMSNAQDELRRLVDRYGAVKPECVIDESLAADAILALAQKSAASLIVMGTHGRRGFDHLTLGSVTERVLRHAPCPVLSIHGNRPDARGNLAMADSVQVQRVLCCVEFSVHSQRALDHALSVAEAYGAEITILHVMENVSESANVAMETDAVMEKLQTLTARSTLPVARIHLEVRLGKAYREILNFAAENQSDVIVTGVRGSNSLDLAVFGSTTYRVVQLYPGPVLTVPSQRALS